MTAHNTTAWGTLFSSTTDLHATPLDFFERLDAEFGFTLDVCANDSNTKCSVFFSEETNGLTQEWESEGAIWCNPPYGRGIGAWMAKAVEAQKRGRTVVMLVPARTDTAWWQDNVMGVASEVRLVRGRLTFGDAENVAPFPSAVIVYRPGDHRCLLTAMGR